MGLSTKQVSGDGIDWGQSLLQAAGGLDLPEQPPPARRPPAQQQNRPEPLPCPRCGSTNTKFCYYNNYNKSQPRHFCKACKRHWTRGGTLRNVPVGGGRKNKRLKTAAAAKSSGNIRSNTHMGHQSQEQRRNISQTLGEQKSISVSEILYQNLMGDSINNTGNLDVKSFSTNNGEFLGSTSTLPLLQNQNPVPFIFPSGLSSFESNSSSISTSIGSSDANYNLTGGWVSMEDSTITTIMPTTSTIACHQPWQIVPTTSGVTDMPNYWNWDAIGSLVNTTDLNMPWDDTDEIKP